MLRHEARDEIFQARLSPCFSVEELGYEAIHTHIRKGYIPLTEIAVSVLLASTGTKSRQLNCWVNDDQFGASYIQILPGILEIQHLL